MWCSFGPPNGSSWDAEVGVSDTSRDASEKKRQRGRTKEERKRERSAPRAMQHHISVFSETGHRAPASVPLEGMRGTARSRHYQGRAHQEENRRQKNATTLSIISAAKALLQCKRMKKQVFGGNPPGSNWPGMERARQQPRPSAGTLGEQKALLH